MALTAQAAMAGVTSSPTLQGSSIAASPHATPTASGVQQTGELSSGKSSEQTALASSLAGIIASAEGASKTQTVESRSTSSAVLEVPVTASFVDPTASMNALSIMDSALSLSVSDEGITSNGDPPTNTPYRPSLSTPRSPQTADDPGPSAVSASSVTILTKTSQAEDTGAVVVANSESTVTLATISTTTRDGHVGSVASAGTISAISSAVNRPLVSAINNGGFVVNGETLVPGSAITIASQNSAVTASMFTDSSETYIALGTSTTIGLGIPDVPLSIVATYTAGSMTFASASDGGLVIDGTTLETGSEVTVGTGEARTALSLASVGGTPAVVVGGTTTEAFGSIGQANTQSLPAVTDASSATGASAGSGGGDEQPTTTTRATNGSLSVYIGRLYYGAVAFAAWIAFR